MSKINATVVLTCLNCSLLVGAGVAVSETKTEEARNCLNGDINNSPIPNMRSAARNCRSYGVKACKASALGDWDCTLEGGGSIHVRRTSRLLSPSESE